MYGDYFEDDQPSKPEPRAGQIMRQGLIVLMLILLPIVVALTIKGSAAMCAALTANAVMLIYILLARGGDES